MVWPFIHDRPQVFICLDAAPISPKCKWNKVCLSRQQNSLDEYKWIWNLLWSDWQWRRPYFYLIVFCRYSRWGFVLAESVCIWNQNPLLPYSEIESEFLLSDYWQNNILWRQSHIANLNSKLLLGLWNVSNEYPKWQDLHSHYLK